MASVPFALSVHSLVSSVGADAGFAAIIGLAILALLYFAHARETANLREEAAELARRLQEAEARLDLAQRSLQAPEPAQVPAPTPRPALGVVGQAAPAAPAGMAAPALAAATRFIPAAYPKAPEAQPTPDEQPAAPQTGTESPATQAPVAPIPRAPATQPPSAPPPVRPLHPPAPAASPVPAPATVAALRTAPTAAPGQTNGSSSGPGRIIGRDEGALPDAPVRAAQARPQPPTRQVLTTSGPARTGPSTGWRVALVVLGLLLIGGAAAAVLILTSGTGTQAPAPAQASNSPKPAAAAFDPAHVTVAVLNGTATNQLAHRVAARLSAAGYGEGQIATASNQTVTTTIVAYRPGAADRTDALHVARTLHLAKSAVAPITKDARAVACPPPGACTANVVVTVGADLANS